MERIMKKFILFLTLAILAMPLFTFANGTPGQGWIVATKAPSASTVQPIIECQRTSDCGESNLCISAHVKGHEKEGLSASFCAKVVNDDKCTDSTNIRWNIDSETKQPKANYQTICFNGKTYEYVEPKK